MIKIEVKGLKEVTRSLDKLANELRATAITRALNKTAAAAKVEASRNIRAAGYNIKARAIKESIVIRRATRSDLTAILEVTGRPIRLINYDARQVARGLSVSVKNGRKVIPGAFVATMKSGHKGAFKRLPGTVTGKRGKPILNRKIVELFGPSIPSAMQNEVVQRQLEAAIRDKFPKLLEHEIAYILLKS